MQSFPDCGYYDVIHHIQDAVSDGDINYGVTRLNSLISTM